MNCTCIDTSSVLCNFMECKPEEECTTANQIRGCYIPSPCLENPCQNGGTCMETPGVGNGTSISSCLCPSTYTGLYCEDEKEANTVVIYIVIGVVVGVFVISLVFMVVAYFYLKSRKRKSKFLDPPDSSQHESDSVSVRSINMAYNEPQIQLNYAENFREDGVQEMHGKDNVNVYLENEECGAQVNLGYEDDDAINGHVNETDKVTIF
ncbi:zonadhesin-like [Bufo bufo]|uniref:zonadhesin-like n=1 Tax=Bufo bufo TaxID=8384 RepID=UPI001ABE44D4|nr:zonadhesin-like [Bufo bufo]